MSSFSFISINRVNNARTVEHPGKRWGHSAIVHNNKMIIFGGRHNQRSLANMFSLDLQTLSWTKIDSYGQTPPARDSHSVLMYKDEMIIFGGSGSGKKLNDMWIFNFETKKWNKIAYSNTDTVPSPRDGHCVALINNFFMMIYGGMDEADKDMNDIYLFDLRNNIWIQAETSGNEPQIRDSQSCTMINNTCYVFGGQGENDERFNDMHQLAFNINESDKKFLGVWSEDIVLGARPPVRTSHSCLSYKNKYIFIVGGEGDDGVPLNDIWIYDVKEKIYTELNIENKEIFEGRFCHSCALINDSIVVYGGMKNAEITLDNLAVLCLDGKIKGDDNETNVVSSNGNVNKVVSTSGFVNKNAAVDTNDLNEENEFNFIGLKRGFEEEFFSFTFVKKMSEICSFPFEALGKICDYHIERSTKEINLEFIEEKHIFVIKTNNNGIPSEEFSQIFSITNKGEDKSFSYFASGELFDVKLMLLRLADEILVISKTKNQLNISIISRNLQSNVNTDVLMTPYVSYKIPFYTQNSDFSEQTLNLILHEFYHLFKNKDELFNYCNNMKTGTHYFLFDMRRRTKSIYEMEFDLEVTKDIYYNSFSASKRETDIDHSFLSYMKFYYKVKPDVDITLFDSEVILENIFYKDFINAINDTTDNKILKLNSLEVPKQITKYSCVVIQGRDYNGILFNEEFAEEDKIKSLYKTDSVILYANNKLQCYLGGEKIGNMLHKKQKKRIYGYIEVNDVNEIVDQTKNAKFYYKVKEIINYLN